MTEFTVNISKNELVDRLRLVQQNLTDGNDHTDALIVGFAIQALSDKAYIAPEIMVDEETIVEVVRCAIVRGDFDVAIAARTRMNPQ